MYQGMYNLTSSMLTQRRKLDVTGHNMVNLQTAGYKSENLISETFREAMYTQTNYYNKKNDKTIGKTSYIRTAKKTVTDFSEGTLSETGNPLDLAIQGKGFFQVKDSNDNIRYTRSGLFKTNPEGKLIMRGGESVLDGAGNEILLPTDQVEIDAKGIITMKNGGESSILGQIGLVSFEDLSVLQREDNGLFSSESQPQTVPQETQILQGYQENSNTDMVENMTKMMSSQRGLQSSAQLLKMYDQITAKASNDIGRV